MKPLFTSLLLACASASFAQQEPLYTQFWNNYAHINPAVSGIFYKHQASALYRDQWDKVNGAPRTLTANYSLRLDAIHGGLGVTYELDKIGFGTSNKANLNYSYHMKLGEQSTLAAGVSAGIVNMGFESNWIPPTNTPDPTLPSNGNGTAFSMNAGLVFKTPKLSVGLSSTQINESTIREVNYTNARHYYLFADYTFNLGTDFAIKPQMIARTDMVKFSTDLNVLFSYRNTYWLGASYRTSDAICFMAGWDIRQKFRIGYSYDLTINQLSSISRGSHEIVLGFMLRD